MFDEKKYNIQEEENVPQIVYGPPIFLEEKSDEVFKAYEGGYGGPNFCYSIELDDNRFLFKTYCEDFISSDPYLEIAEKTEKEYQEFINLVKKEMADWNLEYNNFDVLDGTQWTISFEQEKKEYNGSNAFPKNYIEVKKLFKKYFPSLPEKYEIDFEKENPYADFTISNVEAKYDINPANNIPQKVYGVPNRPNPIPTDSIMGKFKKGNLYYSFSFCSTENGFEFFLTDKEEAPYKRIDLSHYLDLLSNYRDLTSNWQESYTGTKDIMWKIKESFDEEKIREGKGEVPANWNKFINLLMKYEKLYKNEK